MEITGQKFLRRGNLSVGAQPISKEKQSAEKTTNHKILALPVLFQEFHTGDFQQSPTLSPQQQRIKQSPQHLSKSEKKTLVLYTEEGYQYELPQEDVLEQNIKSQAQQEKELDLAFPSIKNIFEKDKPYFCILNTVLLALSIAVVALFYNPEKYPQLAFFWGFYAFFVPIYALYLIEVCMSPAATYLRNVFNFQELSDYLTALKKQAPVIQLFVRAFHYKKMNRAVTYRTKQIFDYKEAQDVSVEITPLLQHLSILRLNLQLHWQCAAGAASTNFEHEKQSLITLAKKYDCHAEVEARAELPKLQKQILAYASDRERPPFLNLFWYALLSLIGLSLPYRIYFNAHTGYIDYAVQKMVLC